MPGKVTYPDGWQPGESGADFAPTPRERAELKELRPSQFGSVKGPDAREPGAHDEANRAALARARALVDEGEAVVKAEDKPVSIDAHIAAVSAQAAQPFQTARQKHETWKAQVRESVADAERAQKTARQEARWAKQEERDAKLRTWLEGKTDEEVSAYLGSESFDRLPEHSQNLVHGILDEIREGNAAEVEFNIEQADEESFEFPTDEEEEDDELSDDEDDDDAGLEGFPSNWS
jgi:hypothetical protein